MTWPVLFLTLLAATPEFDVVGTERTVRGTLRSAGDGHLVVQSATGEQRFAFDELVEVRPVARPEPAGGAAAVWIELADGSLLVALGVRIERGKVRVTGLDGAVYEIELRSVAWIRFAPADEATAKPWADAIANRTMGDVLIVNRKSNSGDFPTLAGTVDSLDEEAIHFVSEGERYDVKRAKLAGLALAVPPAGAPTPRGDMTVALADGSRLQADRWQLADDVLVIHTPAGVELRRPLSELGSIRFAIQYLSDLTPERWSYRSYVSLDRADDTLESRFHRPRFNASLTGGPLYLGKKRYEKGIVAYGGSEIVYRLPADVSALQAQLGIAPGAGTVGEAKVELFADDKSLGRWPVASGSTTPIKVNLAGANRLRLVVAVENERAAAVVIADPRLLK